MSTRFERSSLDASRRGYQSIARLSSLGSFAQVKPVNVCNRTDTPEVEVQTPKP